MKPRKHTCLLAIVAMLPACGVGLNQRLTGSDDSTQGNEEDTAIDACAGDPTFTTYQDAAFVIGQADFTGADVNRGGAPAANTLNEPYGNAAFSDGKFFIPDYNNNRVLGFSSIPSAMNAEAGVVIGQSNFDGQTGGTSATLLDRPTGVGFDSGRLYVLDTGNTRVLGYDSIPTANGAAASRVVVGPADLTTTRSSCDAISFAWAENFRISDGKLILPDTSQDRVLIWNTIPTAADTPADLVLGQTAFTSCTPPVSPTASSVNDPADAATDGTRLAIADMFNSRVLIWNTFPTSNGQPADIVLGQEEMTTGDANHGGISSRSLNQPLGVEFHGSKLYVSDAGNSRVLIWNSIPTENFAPADVVLGQPDFVTSGRNTTRKGLEGTAGIRACGNRLFVGQDGASRYSVFEGQ